MLKARIKTLRVIQFQEQWVLNKRTIFCSLTEKEVIIYKCEFSGDASLNSHQDAAALPSARC